MKTTKRILWGAVLILLGTLWILDLCEVVTFRLFFDGWWTLFIIVPCLIGLITERDKLGNIFGLLIGVGLFCACNDLITFRLFWKLLIPAIVILIGLKLIFGNAFAGKRKKARKKAEEKIKNSGGEIKEYCAAFSALDLDFSGQSFFGAELTAVFGSVRCDLRNASLTEDPVITVCSVFGGVEILLPENVNVSVSVNRIFGGASLDDRRTGSKDVHDITVYVGGNCIFGGANIQ